MWSWRDKRRERGSDDWTDSIDRLLHPGETVEEEVSVGDAQVAVTTQRVIVFTPYTEGENVRYVERPNVVGVEARNSGNRQLLGVGATVGLTGILLVVIGNTLNLSVPETLRNLEGGAVPGAGLAESMVSTIEIIDTLFLALGVLLLANAAVITGYYFLRRKSTVAVAVAGGDDVELSTYEEEDTDRVAGRLRNAIAP